MVSFITYFKRVQGYGVARNGLGAWLLQRKTALMLIPLVLWFALNIFCFLADQQTILAQLLYSPLRFILFTLLCNLSLFHGVLGMKEIIEDYVHCEWLKLLTIFLLQAFTYFTMIALTAILCLNFIVNN